jgi:hypothetical protein
VGCLVAFACGAGGGGLTPDSKEIKSSTHHGGETKGHWVMKYSKRSFVVVSALFALLLPLSSGTAKAGDADRAAFTLAAVQSAKQKCANSCRARYRECRSLKQMTSFECRSVYQDCTRWTCNGLVD